MSHKKKKNPHVGLKNFESSISPSNCLFVVFTGIYFHRWDVLQGFSILAETNDGMESGAVAECG